MQPPSACPSLQPKRSRSLTISTHGAAKPANEPFMAPPKKKYRRLALPAPAPAAIDAATDAPTHGPMCTTPRVAAALSALTNAARRPAGGTRRLSAALPPPRKNKGGQAEDVGSGITQVEGAPLHPHPRPHPHPYPHLRAASDFWSVVPPHKESIRGEPALPLYVWDVARGGATRPRMGARPADWEDQASMTDAPRSARCACCLQLAATAGGAGAGE
jgi:hypothetical protein